MLDLNSELNETGELRIQIGRRILDDACVRDHLMRTNEQFVRLAEAHQEYEHRLELLLGKPFLNQDEQVEETVIKKRKLALKDQMQVIIHRHQV